jgi:hypothetical protein
VGDGHGVGEGPNQFDGGVRSNDLEQPAFAQLFVIMQMLGKRTEPSRRQPLRVVVGLIDYVIGGFGEGFFRIIGYD